MRFLEWLMVGCIGIIAVAIIAAACVGSSRQGDDWEASE